MAKRLISFNELGKLEGLVGHHRKLQERLEIRGADAAEFDSSAQGSPELGRKADGLKYELVALLEQLRLRIES